MQPQNAEQKVPFKEISMIFYLISNSLMMSHLVELMTDDHCINSLVYEDTIEQNTLQETKKDKFF